MVWVAESAERSAGIRKFLVSKHVLFYFFNIK